MPKRANIAVMNEATGQPVISLLKIPKTDVLRRLAALETATMGELKEQWLGLFGQSPPPFNKRFLQSRLGHKIQTLVHGGLKPEVISRLEALGAQLDGGSVVRRRLRADDRPIAGTRLVREYRGVEHVVTVLHDGFDYEGRPYRSLSAVARAITGTQWNGWSFFGLRSQRGTA